MMYSSPKLLNKTTKQHNMAQHTAHPLNHEEMLPSDALLLKRRFARSATIPADARCLPVLLEVNRTFSSHLSSRSTICNLCFVIFGWFYWGSFVICHCVSLFRAAIMAELALTGDPFTLMVGWKRRETFLEQYLVRISRCFWKPNLLDF